jgi:hypothetical protein
MFRENVLTRDDIIDRIATTMVPIAVDTWRAEDPKTQESQFLQPFLKEHPAKGSPCIYSPEGTVLGAFQGYGDMAGKTRTLIENALKTFGPVKLRQAKAVEAHPYRGKGVMSNGSVSLAEYVRPSTDSLAFLNTKSPVISSVTLAAEEFATLAPQHAVAGAKWTLPVDVAKKFSRVTSPMCYQHAPQPDWVTSVRIDAELQTVKDGVAWLRYDGRIASEHRVAGHSISAQETKLTGEGVYDLKTRTMQSILLVGSGTLRWPEAPEKLVTFDAMVEWAGL